MPKGVYVRTWEHRIALLSGKRKFIGIPRPESVRQKISETKRKPKPKNSDMLKD